MRTLATRIITSRSSIPKFLMPFWASQEPSCYSSQAADAELLAKEFYPEFSPIDLVSLSNYNVHLMLMVKGVVSSPFSAETLGSLDSMLPSQRPVRS